MSESKSSNVMMIIILVLVSITTICSVVSTALIVKNNINLEKIDDNDFTLDPIQSDYSTVDIDEEQNETSETTNSNTSTSDSIDNSNARVASTDEPLGMNEWGLAGKYISGNYKDIPVRITKVTRGSGIEENVKKWFENQSFYKYSDPEDGLEWAVVNYQIDLSNIDVNNNNVDKEINVEMRGTNSSGIRYNNKSFIVTAVYASDKEEVKSAEVYEAQFITQLPVGCTDYLIGMGRSYEGAGSTSFFKVE